jgi:hypothetical protein
MPPDAGAGLYAPGVPPEQAPACGCAAPLRRTVLDKRREVVIEACLRCGTTIGYTQTVDWIYPHPHDVRVISITPLRLETQLGRWLARWPLLGGRPGVPADRADIWLAAETRADDEGALARLEATAAAAQRDLPLAERLHRAGAPADPPPAPLPEDLRHFADVQRALGFTTSSPFVDVLLATWSPSPLAGWIAEDAVTARNDRAERLAEAVGGGNPLLRRRAMGYIARAPLPTAEIGGLIVLECRNILAALDALLHAGARTVPSDIDGQFGAFAAALPRAAAADGALVEVLRALYDRIADVHQRRIHIPGHWRTTLGRLLGAP